MPFWTGFWIGFSIIGGIVAVGLIRRFIWKPHRVNLPASMVEELNRFALEFQKAADSMAAIAKKFDEGSRRQWKKKNDMILKNLQRMNRLLRQLNQFFEERVDKIEEVRQAQKAALDGDFESEEEAKKFKKMGSIREEEIKKIDWEEMFRKFRQL